MPNHIVCFVKECKETFEQAQLYIAHLNEYHKIPSNHRCICTVQNCGQIFQKYYSFKRHLLNHKFLELEKTRENQQEILHSSFVENNDSVHINKIRPETYQDNSLMIESLSKIDEHAVELSLSLHKRPNLTRNDVNEIQQSTQNMYKEIAKQIEKLELISPKPDENYFRVYRY